jgi:hypothetical protein
MKVLMNISFGAAIFDINVILKLQKSFKLFSMHLGERALREATLEGLTTSGMGDARLYRTRIPCGTDFAS